MMSLLVLKLMESCSLLLSFSDLAAMVLQDTQSLEVLWHLENWRDCFYQGLTDTLPNSSGPHLVHSRSHFKSDQG